VHINAGGGVSESSTAGEGHNGDEDIPTIFPTLTAHLVSDEARSEELAGNEDYVAAIAVDRLEDPKVTSRRKNKIVGTSVILGLGLVAGLAAELAKSSNNNITVTNAPSTSPSMQPTTHSPSSQPSTKLEGIYSIVSFNSEADLPVESSVQGKALNWLFNSINVLDFSDVELQQRYALATLLFSCTGAGTNATDILSDDFHCNWPGITCGTDNMHVIEINVNLTLSDSAYNSVAVLPRELALLSNSLANLIFPRCSVSGKIPTELGLLSNLNLLLFESLFPPISALVKSGALPSEFGLLSKLEHFPLWGVHSQDYFPQRLV